MAVQIAERLFYRIELLTRRERFLLAVLVWIGLPVLAGVALVAPLVEAQSAAMARSSDAEALHRWVVAEAAALPADALRSQPAPAESSGPVGISQLEQSLVAAGLRDKAVRLAKRPDNGVELGFDPVPFDKLIGWLQSVSLNWGYTIAELRIKRADIAGHVTAGLLLQPLP